MDVSDQLHSKPLHPPPQGKSPWYPLNRRLGEPQNRFGRGGEEINSQALPGLEPPITSVRGGQDMWHACGRGEVFTGFWLGVPKVRDHWEDLGIGGRITLRWTFWRYEWMG
jgi:hypothetical protein